MGPHYALRQSYRLMPGEAVVMMIAKGCIGNCTEQYLLGTFYLYYPNIYKPLLHLDTLL